MHLWLDVERGTICCVPSRKLKQNDKFRVTLPFFDVFIVINILLTSMADLFHLVLMHK